MATLTQRLASTLETFVDDTRRRHQPLYKKLKEHYKDVDMGKNQGFVRRSKYFAAFLLWFMAFNTLYTALRFTVPHYIGEVWGFDWWVVYWCKVVIAYGFVQITANWTCVRFYTSYFEETDDRPDLRKTLWDEYPVIETKPTMDDDRKKDVEKQKEIPKLPGCWEFCPVCQRDRPPRAHHCKVCQKCTLKRDHHCFIIGACIGFFNQRYFVVFTFYLMMYSGICLFLAHAYFRDFIYGSFTVWDYFLPYTLYQCVITGTKEFHHFLLLCQVYTFVWTGPMCASFFGLQLCAISLGKTMHEFTQNAPVKVISGLNENFRCVFGNFWVINFLFPAVIIFRQEGDGMHWPKVRVVVRRTVQSKELLEVKSRSQ